MNKNNLKTGALILALVILASNTIMIGQLKRELREQRAEYDSLESYLRSSMGELQYGVQGQYGEIQDLLLAEQSIFSQTSVELKTQNGQIAVTMRGVPKELAAGETVFARVIADGRQQEQELDENNQAEILVDMAREILPEFVIRSDAGIRQEAMEEIQTSDLLSSHFVCQWDFNNAADGKTPLSLWIESYGEGGLPFAADQVEKAEFILVNSGVVESSQNDGAGSGAATSMAVPVEGLNMEAFQTLEGERIPAHPISDQERMEALAASAGDRIPESAASGMDSYGMGFWADLSEYAAGKDGIRYDVFFMMTIKGGMCFGTPDAVASFSTTKNSTSTSDGEGALMPIFE